MARRRRRVRPFLAAAAARLGGLSGVVRCGSWSGQLRAKCALLLLLAVDTVRPLRAGQPTGACPDVFTAERRASQALFIRKTY